MDRGLDGCLRLREVKARRADRSLAEVTESPDRCKDDPCRLPSRVGGFFCFWHHVAMKEEERFNWWMPPWGGAKKPHASRWKMNREEAVKHGALVDLGPVPGSREIFQLPTTEEEIERNLTSAWQKPKERPSDRPPDDPPSPDTPHQ